MAFTSLYFFIFFPVVVAVFFMVPLRYRWIWLFISSACFYIAFNWQYLLLFLVMILVNYYIALALYDKNGSLRKNLYATGILFNLAILALFKYLPGITSISLEMARMMDLRYPASIARFIFPIGISFFVFTLISYLADVKKKSLEPEKNPALLATFFLFFPRIMMGPIDRAGKVLPQLQGRLAFDYDDMTYGLKLMAWGFFKKLVIADRLATTVNLVYSDPGNYNGPTLLIATLFFSFQIYADFSGYTDIALGAARIFGIRLMPNFRGPYLAISVKDFWNRWHISLSYWLRDYIFLPLAYSLSRKMKKERYFTLRTDHWIYIFAVTVTFIICGIWHGVGWNFVLWGGLYAVFLSAGQLTEKARKRFDRRTGLVRYPLLIKTRHILVTFSLVTFAWVFFRASSINDGLTITRKVFTGWTSEGFRSAILFFGTHGMIIRELVIAIFSVGLLLLTDYYSEASDVIQKLSIKPVALRWTVYFAIILLIVLYGEFGHRIFIYQQF